MKPSRLPTLRRSERKFSSGWAGAKQRATAPKQRHHKSVGNVAAASLCLNNGHF
jgi:hypothetical protein